MKDFHDSLLKTGWDYWPVVKKDDRAEDTEGMSVEEELLQLNVPVLAVVRHTSLYSPV